MQLFTFEHISPVKDNGTICMLKDNHVHYLLQDWGPILGQEQQTQLTLMELLWVNPGVCELRIGPKVLLTAIYAI